MGNAGQFPDNVIFMAISDSGPISFGAWGSDLSLVSPESGQTALVGFRFDGASDAVTLAGMERLDCSANFLTGNDPEAWITGVEMYRGIKYVGLYPGIDLVYEGLPDGLKSTYIVRPGADPGVIILEYSGQEGLSLAPDGSLVLTTRAGPVVHSAPYCYQLIEGSIVEVSSSYRMTGQGGVGFMVGDYDPGYDLVIDPVLKYGLYLRGLGVSEAYGVASDPQGNAYVTGRTFSTPYNVSAGSTGSNAGGTDVVVVKINPEGTLPLFITYLGGEGNDAGYGIQIDASGGVYVVGTTNSTNFPVVNPLQGDNAGLNDAFVMRLAPNGSSLVYSTYLGGNNNDYGYAIALDGANNAYITGSTESSSFSVPSTMKRTSRGGISDAYLLKIRSDGRELIDTEYVGGKVMETGYGIAVDEAGYAYIAGETFSWDFPVKNAAYPTFGGYSDAFVTKIAPAGDPFVYSTYIGGSDMDGARAIDVGSDGSVHVTGLTRSRNFPTKNAFKPVNPGLISSFYTRLEPSGNALNLSTYLTGPGFDEGRGIVVNPAGSVYITGITKAENMQTINASQPHYGGGVSDAFIAKFAEGESYPAYLTYFGGSNKEEAYGIAADGKCGVFISGVTWSDNMPASDPYPPAFTPAGRGGFVALVWDEETCCIPPIAVFEANPSSGYAPLDVKFTDLSSGTPESWSWEFGDGGTSTEQNPLHTYTTVGNYTVNLTVQNNCGTNTTSGTIVALCLEPVADFSANRTSGKVPLSVQFTDSSQNNVTSWSWQFGDGGTSTKQNPVHTYTAPGTYTVNLTVMNNCGSGTASKPMYITAEPCPLPVADFSANRTSGKVPLSVQFTDSSQNNVTSWSWQFGDGTTSIEQNPVHTYTVAGDYTVTLTVTNECGSDSASKQEYITAEPCPPPVANFNANRTSGKAPLSVQFTDLSTNDPDTWLWQFGDGDTSTEQNPVHTYTIPGTYTVNLTVTNECGCDSASKQEFITAEPCPPPVADFSANRTSGKAPLSVQFTDLSTNDPDTWLWQFGDGDTSTEQDPVHTYTTPGTYTVNLTVTNECGCDSASKQEFITAEPCPPPVADFSANQTCGKIPLSVQFTDLSTNDPDTWLWQFGDGDTSTEQNPVHTYTTPGTYTVNLTVTNECGCDSASKQEFISAEPCPPPVADFSANRTSGKAPLSVQFTDLSTNGPDTWLWQFGDGDTSTEQNPVHTYTTPGTYTVTLTVTNECGCDSASKQEFITAEPCPLPVADFSANQTCGKIPLSVQFTDLSTNGPDTWLWQFGDGATSTEQNPVHTYTTPGTYTVTLTVTNECGCDSASRPAYITAQPCPPPVASFEMNKSCGFPPVTIGFTDTSANDPHTWFWQFGDGGTSTQKNPAHTYTVPGVYTVSLTVTNDCGTDSTCGTFYGYSCDPPIANFTANRTSGNAPLAVQFWDTSLNSPSSWHWDFGDGATATDRNPVHTYTDPGTYTVKLTVTNNAGSDWISKPGFIVVGPIIPQPPHLFYGAITIGGQPSLAGTIVSASVHGGGGSIVADKPGQYGEPGASGEKLIVQGQIVNGTPITFYLNGSAAECYDVAAGGNWQATYPFTSGKVTELNLRIQEIPPQPPVAGFTANKTSGPAPLSVAFTDTSTNDPDTWVWDFGDNTTATTQNPVHVYTDEGLYTVSLTVTNADGTDSEIKQNYIFVLPPLPPLPHAFYGAITIVDEDAPAGTFISGVVSGGGGFVITDVKGRYGDVVNDTKNLIIQGSIPEGSPISFYANGIRAECYDVGAGGDWQMTYPYIWGGLTELNLRVTEIPPADIPVANFTANRTSGTAPLAVQFIDTSLNIPTSWFWDFGDGFTSNGRNPVHTYQSPGTYTVSLNVSNPAGTSSLVRPDFITVHGGQLPPVAGFTANTTSGTAPLSVQFTDTSSNNPGSWSWEFGDQTISALQNPVHTYLTAGSYTVNLTASNDFGSGSVSKPGFINVSSPGRLFYINATAGNGGSINPSGLVPVSEGANVTFNIAPLSYYTVQAVTVDGVSKGALYTWSFENVRENHTIVASFRQTGTGGGGGGGGGYYATSTPTPTPTITVTPTPQENGNITPTPTTPPPTLEPVETETAPVPTTTIPPAQPSWSQFPLAWLILIILVIIILAGLAYYYYQKEKGAELFEK